MTATPPGSLGLPLLGETLPFLKDPFEFELVRTRKHGPVWKTRILGSTVVYFAGPEAFSFFTDPSNFTRDNGSPPHMQALLHPDAVPFIDGERHTTRKRLLLAAFTPAAMASYVPKLASLISHYTSQWAEAGEVRLADELSKLAFDVANVLFADADPSVHDAARAADFGAMVRGLVAMPVNLPVTSYGKALKARDRLRDYIKEAVNAREGSGTALGVLKTARGPEGQTLTTAELEIELLHFFFAAHAGLAGALSWAVVGLTQHPEVRARVLAEVDALPPGALTFEDIATMRYTAAVSREVRRAWPLAPSTFFGVATKDLEFDGFGIKRGWKAVGAIWPTLQDSTTFPDPTRFDPDRLDDTRMSDLADNAYVPQGGGTPEQHRCAGEGFTDLIMPLFLAMLLRGYEVEPPDQDLTPGAGGLGPLPKDGLRATVKARTD